MSDRAAPQPLVIKAGDLECGIIDNAEFGTHRFGYNGIASLTHKACAENLFVPTYAGVNLEYLFDGVRHNMEPRWSEGEGENPTPTHSEVRFSGENRATVHIPETPDWGVESWVAYRVVAPHYIDVTVRIQPYRATFQHGYIGTFFASYLHTPEKKEFQFWGRKTGESESRWIETVLPEDQVWTSYRFIAEQPELMDDPFFFGGTSDCVFEKPVMFGRFRDMVLGCFFDRGEGVRFAYRKDGGGEKNPAWDFAFLIPGYKPRRIYTRSLRLMYKPFVSAEEVLSEYDRWAAAASTHR